MSSIYLGATYSLGPWLRDVIVPQLYATGHEITATWVLQWQPGEALGVGELGGLPQVAIEARKACYDDIARAEATVFFTDQPSSTGGYHTELGFATALGKQIHIVGSPCNIFQCSPDITYHLRPEDFLSFCSRMPLV